MGKALNLYVYIHPQSLQIIRPILASSFNLLSIIFLACGGDKEQSLFLCHFLPHLLQTLKIFLYLNLIRPKPMGSSSVAKTPPVEVVFWRWTLPWLLCSSFGWLNHCLRQWQTLRHYDTYGLTIVNGGIRLNLFLECNWLVMYVRLSTAVLLVCLYVPVWLHWIQYMKGCFYGDWLFTQGSLLVCAYWLHWIQYLRGDVFMMIDCPFKEMLGC